MWSAGKLAYASLLLDCNLYLQSTHWLLLVVLVAIGMLRL